ncbi:MAG TPA: tetratricopeptide repeat protein [Tenuifilaceae bacterium]|nr:tetratricopeptide repeat protein [Tenuifilaceae bacterium]
MDFLKKIDSYLDGCLSEEESELFERELKSNSALAREVQQCKELREAVAEESVYRLREKLRKAESSHIPIKNLTKAIVVTAAAASIAFFIVFNVFIKESIPPNEKLFKEYFTSYQIAGNSRDNLGAVQGIVTNRVIASYNSNHFENVIEILEPYIKKNCCDLQATLILASSYLNVGEPKKAEDILSNSLSKNNHHIAAEIIEWYLALSLLKQGKIEEAAAHFNSIKEKNGFYSQNASKILDSLR